ncbi:MAG: hypothetical protein ACR2PI_08105 [Hyphomicrobiaceae bacterium]
MRKLRRRVSALNRRVKAQAKRSPYASVASSGDLGNIKARLARLEAAPRPDGSDAPGADVERTVTDLAAQVAALSRKIDARDTQQAQPSVETARALGELKARLAELESAPRRAAPSATDSQLKRTVANLTVRLAELSREVATQSNRQPQAPPSVTRDVGQLKSRLADLEAAQRAAASRTSDADLKRTVANLSGRIEKLSRALAAETNRPPQVPTAITRDVGELKTRLGQIESTRGSAATSASVAQLRTSVANLAARVEKLTTEAGQRSSGTATPDAAALRKVTESLTRLEQAQTLSANELEKLQTDLEKDRTLVIDYLEDLDNRLSAVEKTAPGANPPATSKP